MIKWQKKSSIKKAFLFLIFLFLVYGSSEAKFREILPGSLPLPSDLTRLEKIRVLISKERSIEIGSNGNTYIYDRRNGYYLETLEDKKLKVQAEGNRLVINGREFRNLDVILKNAENTFVFEKQKYPGELILLNKAPSLFLVNELELEEYLRSVVPSEMFIKWPLEALKAQAIISRTYAVYSILKNPNNYFHVTDSTASQVFRGASGFHERGDQAVRETQGEILTLNNKAILTYFHSTSGGHTAAADMVFSVEHHPSLQGVAFSDSSESPHHNWSAVFSKKELAELFREKGWYRGRFLGLKILETNTWGRVIKLMVLGSEGSKIVLASDARLVMGSLKLKSCLFTMSESAEEISFVGNGWGHGVGMCQWGAKKMAEAGKKYDEIVSYYYPQAVIKQLS